MNQYPKKRKTNFWKSVIIFVLFNPLWKFHTYLYFKILIIAYLTPCYQTGINFTPSQRIRAAGALSQLEPKGVTELFCVLLPTIKKLEAQTGVLSSELWPSAASQFVNSSSELQFLENGCVTAGKGVFLKGDITS